MNLGRGASTRSKAAGFYIPHIRLAGGYIWVPIGRLGVTLKIPDEIRDSSNGIEGKGTELADTSTGSQRRIFFIKWKAEREKVVSA